MLSDLMTRILSKLLFLNLLAVPVAAEDLVIFPDLVVEATPLGRPLSEQAAPISVVQGAELERERAATLGDTLSWQPGVSATSFGAGASRPVIRGFEGPRVSILIDGLPAADVSATSPDHAVGVEPFFMDSVEVLRGPATLAYGSSAIGGLVNVRTRLQPLPQSGPELGLGLRYHGDSEGTSAYTRAQTGTGPWTFAVHGLARRLEDYRIPSGIPAPEEEDHAHEEEEEPDHEEGEEFLGTRVDNTHVHSDFAAFGSTWSPSEGRSLGGFVSLFETTYGVPGHHHAHEEEHEHEEGDAHEEEPAEEEAVQIELRQLRAQGRLEWRDPFPGFTSLQARLAYADYEHVELEGDEVGTQFLQESWEARFEGRHAPVGSAEGAVGLQLSRTDFEAKGEEAFTPPSTTDTAAVFLFEELRQGGLVWQLGGRLEGQNIDLSDASGYDGLATSASAGLLWNLDPALSLGTTLSWSQRHPTATELYADGPHAATRSYEIGEAGLDLEEAYGLDLVLRWTPGTVWATLAAFYNRYDTYIFARPTGAEVEGFDVYAFTETQADIYGAELEVGFQLWQQGDQRLNLSFLSDTVRAVNRSEDAWLPRTPPTRFGSRLSYSLGRWTVAAHVRHALAQDRTAPNEDETPAYTLLGLDFSLLDLEVDNAQVSFLVRLENLTDEVAFNHVSFLKEEAPLPGRHLEVGVEVVF